MLNFITLKKIRNKSISTKNTFENNEFNNRFNKFIKKKSSYDINNNIFSNKTQNVYSILAKLKINAFSKDYIQYKKKILSKNNKYSLQNSYYYLNGRKNFDSLINNKVNNSVIMKKQKINEKSEESGFKNKTQKSYYKCKNKIINKKILVLDLDETLIHSFFESLENPDFEININLYDEIKDIECNKIYVSKRPGLDIFFNELNKFYKIYIFSSSPQDYVSKITKEIDKNKIILKCFSKNDCLTVPGGDHYNIYIKDLLKIDKDLSKIVILDDNITSFSLQTENGIPIKSWYGNKQDIELFKLIPLLKKLSNYKDVRKEIKKFVINNSLSWNKCLFWLKKDNDNKPINNMNKERKLNIFKKDVNEKKKPNKSRFSYNNGYIYNNISPLTSTNNININYNNTEVYNSQTYNNNFVFNSYVFSNKMKINK